MLVSFLQDTVFHPISRLQFFLPFCILQVILRYDVILIQEIRDISGKAIVDLLSLVNKWVSVYTNEHSPRSLEKETGYLEVESGKQRDTGKGWKTRLQSGDGERLDRKIGSSVMAARYYDHYHDPIKAA